MFTLLISLAVLTALLLIPISFLQSSKKEGMTHTLGSGGVSQLIGIHKTGDLLEHITWGLLIGLFAFVLASTLFLTNRQSARFATSPNLEHMQMQQMLLQPEQEETTVAGEVDGQDPSP
ncbi:MAG: preprotein translocase subunit SecG [Bacteroidota bacterium]